VLVAWWPDWPVVAAGCRPDQPAAVVAANRVVAVTPAARAEGVMAGIRRREAQGRCPGLDVVAADPGRDARAWEPVVAAVEVLTPAVEVLAAGALCFSARAASRYYGGDQALADRIREATESAGLVPGYPGCRIGVADGRFAAGLAARAARSHGSQGEAEARSRGSQGEARAGGGVLVIPPGGSRAWLAPQPVQALGPALGDLTDLLFRLGLRTLGDLAALPGPTVLGRFGLEGQAARRLAMGGDDRAVQARQIPPDLSCTAELDPPEQRVEAAAFVAKALADDLHARLNGAGLVTTAVAIQVETEHGETLVRNWRHEGALNAQALAERTRWQLDGWLSGTAGRAPTGGLTLLRLTPLEVRPDAGRQLGIWGGMADVDARATRAMARVQGLLGPEAVVTAVQDGGRGHAERVRLVPWGDALERPGTSRPTKRTRTAKESPALEEPWPGRLPPPAPPLVYRRLLGADVCGAGGQPVEVSGRGEVSTAPAALAIAGGPLVAVAGWAGPWPVEERWWDGGARRRARFQVVLESGEAHLVCREGGRWWVEATYS
jgi:protein ImuB